MFDEYGFRVKKSTNSVDVSTIGTVALKTTRCPGFSVSLLSFTTERSILSKMMLEFAVIETFETKLSL